MFEGAFVPPELMAAALPFVEGAFIEVMEAYRHLATFGFLVSDTPRGRVVAAPGMGSVVVYSPGPEEMAKVRQGLEVLARIFFAAGARRVFLPLARHESHADLSSALQALQAPLDARAVELTAFHPLGTARMVVSRAAGVVDPDLQAWQMPGLYVVGRQHLSLLPRGQPAAHHHGLRHPRRRAFGSPFDRLRMRRSLVSRCSGPILC